MCLFGRGTVTSVARPTDVLDVQTQLASWWRSRLGQLFGVGFMKSLMFKTGAMFVGPEGRAIVVLCLELSCA